MAVNNAKKFLTHDIYRESYVNALIIYGLDDGMWTRFKQMKQNIGLERRPKCQPENWENKMIYVIQKAMTKSKRSEL